MNYYAYVPTAEGKEPLGTFNKLLFELKTDRGAIKHAVRSFGHRNFRLFRYRNLYDETTFTPVFGGDQPPGATRPAHHRATKKSPAQLQHEIDEVLGRGAHSTVTGSWEPREGEITSTAGLMAIAAAVARELKRSGMTWGDTSRGRGRNVRIWSSGTSVRFEVPSRYQGHPSEAGAIVDLHLVGPDRSRTTVGPFAGDAHYDKRFGEAMEQRVRQLLKKGVR